MIVKRVLRGFGANVWLQVVVASLQLILTPLLIAQWGAANYGTWLLISAIPSYLAIGDLGLGTAAANRMCIFVSAGDFKAADRTFQSARLVVMGMSAILLLLVIGAAYLAHTFYRLPQAVVIAGLLLGLYAIVSLQGGVQQGVLRASGLYARGLALHAAIMLLEGLTAAILVLRGGGFVHVACAYFAVRLFGFLILLVYAARFRPWISDGVKRYDMVEIKVLTRLSGSTLAIPFAQATYLQGTVMALGWVAGGVQITAFATSRTISRLGVQAVSMLNHALMPEMSHAWGARNFTLVKKVVVITIMTSVITLVPFSLLFALGGKWFIEVWTRHHVVPPFDLIFLFAAITFVNGIWHTLSNLLLACNLQAKFSYAFSAFSLLSLPIVALLSMWRGATGAAGAVLLLEIVMLIVVGRQIARHFLMGQTSIRAMLKDAKLHTADAINKIARN